MGVVGIAALSREPILLSDLLCHLKRDLLRLKGMNLGVKNHQAALD